MVAPPSCHRHFACCCGGKDSQTLSRTPAKRERARVSASPGSLLADLEHPVTKYLLNYAPMPTTISAACWAVIGQFVIEAASDVEPTSCHDAQTLVGSVAQMWHGGTWVAFLSCVRRCSRGRPLTDSSGLRQSCE